MDPVIKYSQLEREKLLAEVMDKEKIQLVCSAFPNGKRHRTYIGGLRPPDTVGCKHCWQAYWWYIIATTPPHLREERLSGAEKVVGDAVQMAERGEFDFEVYDHAEISIEKDAMDDETRVYTPEADVASEPLK